MHSVSTGVMFTLKSGNQSDASLPGTLNKMAAVTVDLAGVIYQQILVNNTIN